MCGMNTMYAYNDHAYTNELGFGQLDGLLIESLLIRRGTTKQYLGLSK